MRLMLLSVGCAAQALAMVGCSQPDQGYREAPKGTKVKQEAHEHDHGPHGGHLVELGNEEYHAEVTFDAKAGKITIYILDSNAKKSTPLDAKEVTLELVIDGKPKPLAAAAVPQQGDPQGKSSRFEVAGNADVEAHVKDDEDLKGRVNATIGGKAYSGEIVHEHGH